MSVFEIRYEHFVNDANSTVDELLKFIGLERNIPVDSSASGALFEVHKFDLKSLHANIDRDSDSKRAEAYKAELSTKNMILLEGWGGDMLLKKGYRIHLNKISRIMRLYGYCLYGFKRVEYYVRRTLNIAFYSVKNIALKASKN